MNYRTVYEGGKGEIVEKKSRFIGEVFSVETEEEAAEIVGNIKKQYWDARHHCWAYVIGGAQVQERFSDDGEPGGTAGKPILEVIRGHELKNVLVVVTRYFGGTLLGTGGLVRAYTQSAQAGIEASTLITKTEGYLMKIGTDYSGLGKLQYLLAQRGLQTVDADYGEAVTLSALVSEEEEKALKEEITAATNGQAVGCRAKECWFACVGGRVVEF